MASGRGGRHGVLVIRPVDTVSRGAHEPVQIPGPSTAAETALAPESSTECVT